MTIWQEISQKKQGFWLFIPLTLIYMASYFQRTALPGTIYDSLTGDLHINASQVTALAAAFLYPYATCQLVSGFLIDRFCGTRVVLAGGLLFLAGVFLFPAVSNIHLLYLARALTGIGASTMYLSLVKETDRLFGRKNYAIMFGIAYSCGYAGGLMGSMPFEQCCAYFPWRNVLFGAAFIAAAIYLLLVLNFRRAGALPPIPKQPFSLKAFADVIKNPLSWLISICGGITFDIYMIVQTVLGKKFLQDFTGMSSKGAAWVIFILTLICISTMLTTSILTRLSGNRRRPLVIAACGLCAFSVLAMIPAIFFNAHWLIFVILYCLFAAAAGMPPIFSMLMQEYNAKDNVAQSSAISNMFGYLGMAILAQLAGALLDHFEPRISASGAVIYSTSAYMVFFVALSILGLTGFLLSWKLPETRGHYLRLHTK